MRLAHAVIFLFVSAGFIGCASVDRARADRHEAKAQRAAEHGNFRKAEREERKAEDLDRRANTDPLP